MLRHCESSIESSRHDYRHRAVAVAPASNWCLLHGIEHGTRIKNKTDTLQDKAFDEIKSFATLSLGRMEHSNLSGCLESPVLSFKKQLWVRTWAYTMISRVGSIATLTETSFPFSSFAFVTLNTERIDDATMKSVDSTR